MNKYINKLKHFILLQYIYSFNNGLETVQIVTFHLLMLYILRGQRQTHKENNNLFTSLKTLKFIRGTHNETMMKTR